MDKKPSETTADEEPSETPAPPAPPKKKNLSLDITDVSEVLERKISP
jgi:hypothetical protein